ncbi:MAG: anhydro-N-acetylmuramic acid kinase, partial [Bdellovibrionota bacterium]
GNILIDAAAQAATRGRQTLDRDGILGAKGRVNEPALKRLLRHPYYRKGAPKSTGRDDFPVKKFLAEARVRGADLVATATALTVESIAKAYEDLILKKGYPLRAIFVSGGGAKNPTLMEWLQMRLPEIRVAKLSEEGFDGQLIEAQGFACFGYLALHGQPVGGPWTGVRDFGPPAHITPGRNWNEIVATRS